MPTSAPVPNTGPIKFVIAGAGFAAGALASGGIGAALPSRAEVRASQRPLVDETTARIATGVGLAALAAGKAGGLLRRSDTAGFTTAALMTSGAFTTTLVTLAQQSHKDEAPNLATALVGVAGAYGAGALLAVRDEHHPGVMRFAGLGALMAAIGVLAPVVAPTVMDHATTVRQSIGYSPQRAS